MTLGFGVMIGMLGGNRESVEAFQAAIGKEIAALDLDEERLLFTFADKSKMKLSDEGQSCCGHRYMHSDDDIQAFVGAKLMNGEIRDGPEQVGEWGEVHEVQFLVITTSKGAFTVETHNEHNGYYGGFWIQAAIVD